MNTKDIKLGEKHFTLIKGAPGTGKSIAAHSYHILGPTYTFDFDRKMDAVASAYKGVNFEYDQFDDVFLAIDKLESFRKNCPYKVIIWDGWHTFAFLALQSVMDIRKPSAKKIMKGNIEQYQLSDYMAEGRALEEATTTLQYLSSKGINVITVAHWRRIATYNPQTQQDEVVEGLFIPGGKVAFSVPIPYNELYWCYVGNNMKSGETEHLMETDGPHETKTVLKVPKVFSWEKTNFCKKLMELHEKESKVISL